MPCICGKSVLAGGDFKVSSRARRRFNFAVEIKNLGLFLLFTLHSSFVGLVVHFCIGHGVPPDFLTDIPRFGSKYVGRWQLAGGGVGEVSTDVNTCFNLSVDINYLWLFPIF